LPPSSAGVAAKSRTNTVVRFCSFTKLLPRTTIGPDGFVSHSSPMTITLPPLLVIRPLLNLFFSINTEPPLGMSIR